MSIPAATSSTLSSMLNDTHYQFPAIESSQFCTWEDLPLELSYAVFDELFANHAACEEKTLTTFRLLLTSKELNRAITSYMPRMCFTTHPRHDSLLSYNLDTITLDLTNSIVTDATLIQCTNLQSLWIAHTATITDKAVARLYTLRRLHLGEGTAITGVSLPNLPNLTELRVRANLDFDVFDHCNLSSSIVANDSIVSNLSSSTDTVSNCSINDFTEPNVFPGLPDNYFYRRDWTHRITDLKVCDQMTIILSLNIWPNLTVLGVVGINDDFGIVQKSFDDLYFTSVCDLDISHTTLKISRMSFPNLAVLWNSDCDDTAVNEIFQEFPMLRDVCVHDPTDDLDQLNTNGNLPNHINLTVEHCGRVYQWNGPCDCAWCLTLCWECYYPTARCTCCKWYGTPVDPDDSSCRLSIMHIGGSDITVCKCCGHHVDQCRCCDSRDCLSCGHGCSTGKCCMCCVCNQRNC